MNINSEIERILEEFDKSFLFEEDYPDGVHKVEYPIWMNGNTAVGGSEKFLHEIRCLIRQSLLAISKKTYEAVRVEEADHAKEVNPDHDKDEMYRCLECESDKAHNAAVTKQKSNAQAWFGEEV